MSEIDRLKAENARLRERHATLTEILSDACKVYCRWYDRGEPSGTSASQIAYDMVSQIRQALAELYKR